jgi:hypothetical protein
VCEIQWHASQVFAFLLVLPLFGLQRCRECYQARSGPRCQHCFNVVFKNEEMGVSGRWISRPTDHALLHQECYLFLLNIGVRGQTAVVGPSPKLGHTTTHKRNLTKPSKLGHTTSYQRDLTTSSVGDGLPGYTPTATIASGFGASSEKL